MTHPSVRPQLSILSETSLLLRIGDGESVDERVIERVWAITAALDAARLRGVIDIVPGYCTLLLQFNAEVGDIRDLLHTVETIANNATDGRIATSRVINIPICYGGELGPDLGDVALQTGLSEEQLVHLHSGASYQVACMGFAPGWAYLIGLPPALHVPRRANPRPKVPAGSLAVGGGLTGVYPLDTPGGWHLIGRSPLKMFDPDRAEPFLLQPGDAVRFQPIGPEDFARIAADE